MQAEQARWIIRNTSVYGDYELITWFNYQPDWLHKKQKLFGRFPIIYTKLEMNCKDKCFPDLCISAGFRGARSIKKLTQAEQARWQIRNTSV